jgi:hydrogenase maturation protein HypF
VAVQHHHAHFAACLAEHAVTGPALGVIWDGTGYGVDGTIWGGEFLLGDAAASVRTAYLLPFRLPGGDAAVREPARVAVALLRQIFGKAIFDWDELAPVSHFDQTQRGILERMIFHGINSPLTSSAGRLFDGVAALLGLRQRVTFEGQAAIELEHLADPSEQGSYPFNIIPKPMESLPAPVGGVSCAAEPLIIDWQSAIVALLNDLKRGVTRERIAARFHNGAMAAIAEVADLLAVEQVALSGGCFQNRLLVEGTIIRLETAGHHAHLPRLVPANDGGISFGQIAATRHMTRDA